MKKLFMTAAIIGAFALTSNAVLAEHHDEGDEHKGKRMERVDTDGDGSISKAEFIAKHEAMFVKMDKDGNGELSKEEMKNGKKHMRKKMKERMDNMKESHSEE